MWRYLSITLGRPPLPVSIRSPHPSPFPDSIRSPRPSPLPGTQPPCGRTSLIRLAAATSRRLPLRITRRSLSPILAAAFMPPRGRPTLALLSLVASSSVTSLSSASSCDGAVACLSLALASSPAFRRNSALLAAYLGPSSLSSSPRARTILRMPTAILSHPDKSSLRSTLTHSYTAAPHTLSAIEFFLRDASGRR